MSTYMSLTKQAITILVIIFTILINLVSAQAVSAKTLSYPIVSQMSARPAGGPGEVFFTTTFPVNYQSGQMVLSSNPDGTGFIWVDDEMEVIVSRNGVVLTDNVIDFSNGCSALHQTNPKDITSFFTPGESQLKVELKDLCGGNVSNSSFYLVNLNAPDSTPNPTPTPSPTATSSPTPSATPIL